MTAARARRMQAKEAGNATDAATWILTSMSQSPTPLYHVCQSSVGQRMTLMKLKKSKMTSQAMRAVAPMLRLRKCQNMGGRMRSIVMKLKVAKRMPEA